MIEARTFAGKTAAVFGLGLSGVAAARSLAAGGASVLAWDDGERARNAAKAAGIPLCDLTAARWSGIDALVLAPGVPLTHPEPHWTVKLAHAHGTEIIGDTEIFVRERRSSGKATKLIAVTGTNGKSTTTALIHHILTGIGISSAAGGNIGSAALDLPAFDDGCHYVLELSSFQLDLTPNLDPNVAVLLNVTPDHLDRHGTLDHYTAVKEKIFCAAGAAVIGADDAICRAIARRVAAQGIKTSLVSIHEPVSTGVYAQGQTLFEAVEGTVQNEVSLKGIGSLRGSHNAQNAAAALVALRQLGQPWPGIAASLRSFPGLAHRMEEVRKIANVLYINDSKATNGDAAGRALLSFSNICWIAGGKPKDGGITGLSKHFHAIRKAFLIGEAAGAFARTLAEAAVPFVVCTTLDKAVAEASDEAHASGATEAVVLLSPACASYDQFSSFEERGNAFRALVQALPAALPAGESAV
jgi:UDP-N-acetylmuramoylalanine--D-glutamate ligase